MIDKKYYSIDEAIQKSHEANKIIAKRVAKEIVEENQQRKINLEKEDYVV